jgi:hypothetical protein
VSSAQANGKKRTTRARGIDRIAGRSKSVKKGKILTAFGKKNWEWGKSAKRVSSKGKMKIGQE